MEEQKNKELEIHFRDLFAVLLHCWWIMLIVAAVVFISLFIYTNATHEEVYTGTATVYVMKDSENTSTGDVSISNTLINDYLVLKESDNVLEQVRFDLGLTISVDELRSMIKMEQRENTRWVYVSATASKPQDAADIADAVATVACEHLNEKLLNGQLYAKVSDDSRIPKEPSNPISMIKILLFSFIAAVLVYAIYLVLFLLDDKINAPEDVEKYLELSILGQIPNKHDTGRRKKYYSYESVNQ